ncbi:MULTISPECIES: DUF3274 domain-containing protein [unclassified Caballeronia]|uniref:T6SS effector phospholipase Tle3 domain-containing protein n=1 Tax=unclassified Caballeronia TaxID=2646786 RepID=UPI002855B745|nr:MULTISPECIES: DUF3274 domain-containing protein [unclassified Caballeronia]MDR5750070.1 DUF3274 domain-containing protein [Caballeronia sp. LZ024]MDR5842802.1 DUF3274 domain-containing protein [Caballeronia sp. LZ031]
MSDTVNQADSADGAQPDDRTSKRHKLKVATNVVPMQRDHLGQPFWESYQTPASYQVYAECRVPPHLPGIIIFVHGVNSEGEWYDDAEAALCEGLNKRLNRLDLQANEYSSVDETTRRPTPRRLTKLGNSPVIRFYWGYSAKEGTEKKWRIPLRNYHGFDAWAPECIAESGPWYWGGGPFQNGTNNLQQCWSQGGLKRHVFGFDLQHLNTETDRQLQDAPPRLYYAHAAQRLADLVDEIRAKCPHDTITLMSHSQGTMIAMAATTLCKQRAPDALFVMNSPYAMDDKITDAVACGGERPTAEARVNTFRNIANRIKQDKLVFTESLMQQLQCGATEDMNFWRPDLKLHWGLPERDNHGRVYVYFSPHDRVMGATPLQSIGWQGLDHKLLAELGDTVKQRMLARGTPCGDEPGVQKFGTLPPIPNPPPGVKPTDFWDGNRGVLGGLLGVTDIWATPNPNQTVTINAEKVPEPLTAEEMKEFDKPRRAALAWGGIDPDDGKPVDDTFRYMASIYQPEEYEERDDIYATSGRSRSRETQEEMQTRIFKYSPEPTDHSSVPGNVEFMKRVVAFDLPIGFCDAYDNREFWFRLLNKADWTYGYDSYFNTGDLGDYAMPDLVDKQTVALEKSEADARRLQRKGEYEGH